MVNTERLCNSYISDLGQYLNSYSPNAQHNRLGKAAKHSGALFPVRVHAVVGHLQIYDDSSIHLETTYSNAILHSLTYL